MRPMWVVVFIVVAIGILWWMQPPVSNGTGEGGIHYPWEVEVTPKGTSRVLGLHLGEDTLGTVRRLFGDRMQIGLFESPDGRLGLEAFYGELTLGGLTARVVLNAELPSAVLEAIRERARNRTRLESGVTRYQLAREDLSLAMDATVTALTYLPAADFDEALVRGRFGEPEAVLEASDQARHFLYPGKGLDLVLGSGGQAALQYVPPRDFERLIRPLEQSADGQAG